MISEADIVMKERGALPVRGRLVGRLHLDELVELESKRDARWVQDAMTSPAIVIRPTDAVADAAALMVDYGIKRLPVVDAGRLVGIVTRTDLVRAFIRPDEEILREIQEDVLVGALWLSSPEKIEVGVQNGAVTLVGELETHSDAQLLPDFIRRVPGVVSVDSSLTWRAENNHQRAYERVV